MQLILLVGFYWVCVCFTRLPLLRIYPPQAGSHCSVRGKALPWKLLQQTAWKACTIRCPPVGKESEREAIIKNWKKNTLCWSLQLSETLAWCLGSGRVFLSPGTGDMQERQLFYNECRELATHLYLALWYVLNFCTWMIRPPSLGKSAMFLFRKWAATKGSGSSASWTTSSGLTSRPQRNMAIKR